MHQPGMGNTIRKHAPWAADNGCFAQGDQFNPEKWWKWLTSKVNSDLLFAVAPDVVGNAEATIERSAPWLQRMSDAGYPRAFVAQDGLESIEPDWSTFDTLFIGGRDPWRYRYGAEISRRAKEHEKWLHVGRVNSLRRLYLAYSWEADSVDGTYLTFGPDTNLPKVLGWLEAIKQQPLLF